MRASYNDSIFSYINIRAYYSCTDNGAFSHKNMVPHLQREECNSAMIKTVEKAALHSMSYLLI